MLMGATLPLVVHSSLARGTLVGPRVGLLYAANTTGAITGALVAGFVLIGTVGIARSFQIAATLNAIVGVSALALAFTDRSSRTNRREAPGRIPVAPATTDMSGPGEAVAATGRSFSFTPDTSLVPLVFAVSGFAALGLEVVWFRVLVLIVAATSYAFTTMLAAVLFGIAAGSALATPLLQRSWNWVRAFGLAQMATGMVTVASMAVYLRGYNAGWLRGSDYVAALCVIVPPALAMGFAFPVGIRAWTLRHDLEHTDSAARVARMYALNVAGAIVGSVAAGFVLIPSIGTRFSLLFFALCFVAAGVALVWRGTRGLSWGRLATPALAAALFVPLAGWLPSPFAAVQGRRVPPGERPFFLEEGRQTTVGVYSRPMGGRVLYLDGCTRPTIPPTWCSSTGRSACCR
jgi:spermidine synthase